MSNLTGGDLWLCVGFPVMVLAIVSVLIVGQVRDAIKDNTAACIEQRGGTQ